MLIIPELSTVGLKKKKKKSYTVKEPSLQCECSL